MPKVVDAIVRYLTPRILEPPAAGGPGSGGDEAGRARYCADGGEEPDPGELLAQPEDPFLVSIIGRARNRWVTEGERSRCEAGLQAGTATDEVAMSGLRSGLVKVMVSQRPGGVRRDPPAHTLLTVNDVAEHLGVNVASKMPEFKVAAVRLAPAGGRSPTTDARDLDLTEGRT